MHWHGNIYPSVAIRLTSEGPWAIWENTEACWTCQRCKVAGNNPGPINMFAVHQTVLSFCIRVGKQLALYQRENSIWKSSVNFSWLWRFQPKPPVSQTPQTVMSIRSDLSMCKLLESRLCTITRRFVKKQLRGHEGWQHIDILIHQVLWLSLMENEMSPRRPFL